MKTRIAIIVGISSIAALSFAFSSLDNSKSTKPLAKSNPQVGQNEPLGGFAAEEIKR